MSGQGGAYGRIRKELENILAAAQQESEDIDKHVSDELKKQRERDEEDRRRRELDELQQERQRKYTRIVQCSLRCHQCENPIMDGNYAVAIYENRDHVCYHRFCPHHVTEGNEPVIQCCDFQKLTHFEVYKAGNKTHNVCPTNVGRPVSESHPKCKQQ